MSACECLGWPEALKSIAGYVAAAAVMCAMFWAMRHSL